MKHWRLLSVLFIKALNGINVLPLRFWRNIKICEAVFPFALCAKISFLCHRFSSFLQVGIWLIAGLTLTDKCDKHVHLKLKFSSTWKILLTIKFFIYYYQLIKCVFCQFSVPKNRRGQCFQSRENAMRNTEPKIHHLWVGLFLGLTLGALFLL